MSPREATETINLRDRIQAAYAEKDAKKFLGALRDIYCALTDCKEIPQEINEVLRVQLDPSSENFEGKGFLDDPHKWDLEIPLREGGDPHLTVYKEGENIELVLKGEVTPDIESKFKELGL